MAKFPAPFLLLLIVAAGCQQQPATIVDRLPSPNFSGPVFDDAVKPPPIRPAVAVRPERPSQPPPVPAPPPAPVVPAEWMPVASPNQWKWIVIHHSATPDGGAVRFNRVHQNVRKFDELGYHFVIGNGTDTADGQIEVGPRWPKQKWGAHDNAEDNRYNEHGIGICLVGNFDLTHPSEAQIKSLEKLVAYLMKTYHIPADRVLGHGETKSTECPGRYLDVDAVRRDCADMVASGNAVATGSSQR